MNVVLIGSGNTATVLGRLLLKSGHIVIQVTARNKERLKILADELNAEAVHDLQHVSKDADLYIIAVSDSSIKDVALELHIKNKLVVHTSGSTAKDILQNTSSQYGVLYPVQSLRKENMQLPIIPFFVDGSSQEVTETLLHFAKTLSTIAREADDEQRLKLHTAAVIVSNFTNHLYALTAIFCNNEQIDFSTLLPLINETANRLQYFQAAQMQTGPASRNDLITIDKQLKMLEAHPALEKVYRMMSESILQLKGKGY